MWPNPFAFREFFSFRFQPPGHPYFYPLCGSSDCSPEGFVARCPPVIFGMVCEMIVSLSTNNPGLWPEPKTILCFSYSTRTDVRVHLGIQNQWLILATCPTANSTLPRGRSQYPRKTDLSTTLVTDHKIPYQSQRFVQFRS